MFGKNNLKLIIVFSVALSLATLVGPLSSQLRLPSVQLAHANMQSCQVTGSAGSCSEFWYPAGSEMNTELVTIFSDETAEYANLQSPSPSIDFTDTPCSPSVCTTLTTSPNFLITAPVPQTGYYEVQFHLDNNFWGCGFSFGNSACGVQIRQGIAHMIDKNSFTTNQQTIAGQAVPIDNPVPTTSAGGLPSPNPCGYDASFPQSQTTCLVGATGGLAYHMNPAAGANGFAWLFAPGSADLNAAAQHFVNAGLATGFNAATSILTGVSPAASSNPITFFVRNDDISRLDLGTSLAEQICYLFTGAYSAIPTCSSGANTYLTVARGPSTAFPGFATSTTVVNLNWWMYTAAYTYIPYFDDSLYNNYNSRFVSGIPSIVAPTGPCSPQSVPTASATNYLYACSSTYDSLSSQMEISPCLSALGDPVSGAASNLPTSPGNGICASTSQLSAHSAGIQAEANFGTNVFTLPIFERKVQYGYLNNGWIRAVNNNDVGLPNYFTWLNTYNPSPALAGTIRQGFSQTTRSVDPFVASTPQDTYIVRSVYDSLDAANPLSPTQLINWITTSTSQFSSNLGYTAPAGTVATYRFTLRPDIFFQDGSPLTVYDVAFSYLSMSATGAFLGAGASPITGITILSRGQFDINVNSLGPFVLANLASVPILPARYWTSAGGAAWDSAISSIQNSCRDSILTTSTCFPTQFTLTTSAGSTPTISECTVSCIFPPIIPASLMTVNPSLIVASYDPIASHTFVGSGPWQCGVITGSTSGSCTNTGAQNPPVGGSYVLNRFGCSSTTSCPVPASSVNNLYFRSSGDLALYIWSANNGDLTHDFVNFSQVAFCFGRPVNLLGPCGHWQQGIGNAGETPVGINQVSIIERFFGYNWVSPFNWQTSPPVGIGAFPPVLYEGSATLNPASVVGCASPYPAGGYDC